MFSPLYTKIEHLYSIGGNFVYEYTIQLSSLKDVMRFVSLCTKLGFPITVGSDSYYVNGNSFMGMFTLDWRKHQTARLRCTEEEAERFRQEAARFLTE